MDRGTCYGAALRKQASSRHAIGPLERRAAVAADLRASRWSQVARGGTVSQLDATQLVIGDAPQYFFDDGLIEEVQHVTRRLHRPVSVADGPLIESDRPWEHVT